MPSGIYNRGGHCSGPCSACGHLFLVGRATDEPEMVCVYGRYGPRRKHGGETLDRFTLERVWSAEYNERKGNGVK